MTATTVESIIWQNIGLADSLIGNSESTVTNIAPVGNESSVLATINRMRGVERGADI